MSVDESLERQMRKEEVLGTKRFRPAHGRGFHLGDIKEAAKDVGMQEHEHPRWDNTK